MKDSFDANFISSCSPDSKIWTQEMATNQTKLSVVVVREIRYIWHMSSLWNHEVFFMLFKRLLIPKMLNIPLKDTFLSAKVSFRDLSSYCCSYPLKKSCCEMCFWNVSSAAVTTVTLLYISAQLCTDFSMVEKFCSPFCLCTWNMMQTTFSLAPFPAVLFCCVTQPLVLSDLNGFCYLTFIT